MAGRRRFVTAAALVIAAAAASAMVVPLSLPELVAQSDVVVHAEVLRLESSWTQDRSSIHTDVTLQVIEIVLSDEQAVVPDELTFRIAGGIVDGQEVRTSVDPTFTEGDEGIFFLSSDGGGNRYALVGGAQGYLQVEGGMLNVSGTMKPLDAVIAELRNN